MYLFQNSINRTFEETESLLAHLRQGTAQQQQEQVELTASLSTPGAKKPKVSIAITHFPLLNSNYTIFGNIEESEIVLPAIKKLCEERIK